jgi:serine/threonine protein kinase
MIMNKEIKIIDFGFAVQLGHEREIKGMCGTPCYMAPEIIMNK